MKRAVELVRTRKQSDATELKKTISDPTAKKLVEWVVLRSDDSGASFERYAAFITENPAWPSIVTLRRKAEAAAWQDKADNGRVRAFLPNRRRCRPKAASRWRARCSRRATARQPRPWCAKPWRSDGFSQDVEKQVHDGFREFITTEDDKARMDRRLYEKDDTEAGVRPQPRSAATSPRLPRPASGTTPIAMPSRHRPRRSSAAACSRSARSDTTAAPY